MELHESLEQVAYLLWASFSSPVKRSLLVKWENLQMILNVKYLALRSNFCEGLF
jgi:hypothetical protein